MGNWISSTWLTVTVATVLPCSYVSLVQLFDRNGTDRNDERSIRKRFIGSTVSSFISLIYAYHVLKEITENPLYEMGIRYDNLPIAIAKPFILMNVLYLGQYAMMYYDRALSRLWDIGEWSRSLRNLGWIRDVIVGPVTEEIVFRCCSAVMLSQVLSLPATVFLSPLSFAVSHFHHVGDDLRKGFSLQDAMMRRSFQFGYTYIFGVFSTYLLLKTRHFAVPIIAHSICNSFGLPRILDIENYPKRSQKTILWVSYIAGLCGFVYLLPRTASLV